MKKGYKTIFTVIVAAFLLSTSLAGCYFLPPEEQVLTVPIIKPQEITYETVEVKKGSIEKSLEVVGAFISSDSESYFFKNKSGVLKSLNVSLGDKVKPGDLLAELETGSLESQIKEQQFSLRLSQIDYENTKANPKASPSDIEKSSIYFQREAFRMEELKKEYEKSKLYCNIEGEVVYVDKLSEGDNIAVNKTVVTVADPKKIQVEFKGSNAGEFYTGAKVTVKYEEKEYAGVVVGSPNDVPEDGSEELKDVARIKLLDIPDNVRIGAFTTIKYVIQRKDNVLIIPRSLVTNFSGRNYVQIMEDGIKSEVDVELGIETATEVEVVSGLNEGDQVYVR